MKLRVFLEQGAAWPILGHILSVLAQFALLKAVAVFWGTERFGQFSLVLAVAAAVNILFFGPFTEWALRDYQRAKEDGAIYEYFHVLNVNIIFGIALIFILASLFSILVVFVPIDWIGMKWYMIPISSMLGIAISLNNLIYSLLTAAKFPGLSAALTTADSLLRIIAILLVWWFGYGSIVEIVCALFVTQIIMLLTGCSRLFFVHKEERLSAHNKSREVIAEYRSSMFVYAWPFLVWGVFGYSASMGDKWVLANYVSTSELGVYSAMALVSIGMSNAISLAVNKGVIPVIFRISGTGSEEYRSRRASMLVNLLVLMLGCLFSVLILLSYFYPNEIITILTSDDFTSHSHYLWMLMIAAAAFNLSQSLIVHGLLERTPAIYLPSKLVHGSVILAALIYLVPIFGIGGAVYALLFGNIMQLLMVCFVNKKLLRSSALLI